MPRASLLFACKQMELPVYQTTEHHSDFLQIVYTKKGTCYFCSGRKKSICFEQADARGKQDKKTQ